MMDPVAEIRERFVDLPAVRFEEGPGWICILPSTPQGFAVGFHLDEDGYVVTYEGWHQRFHDPNEALDCFAFGLSDLCRLKIVFRGATPHRWVVEHLSDDAWHTESETGLLLFPFWRRSRVVYRQNALVPRVGRLPRAPG